MGAHDIDKQIDESKSQAFMKALLEDLRALEYMIEAGRLETGVTRIGAEQEMDRLSFPSAVGPQPANAR